MKKTRQGERKLNEGWLETDEVITDVTMLYRLGIIFSNKNVMYFKAPILMYTQKEVSAAGLKKHGPKTKRDDFLIMTKNGNLIRSFATKIIIWGTE